MSSDTELPECWSRPSPAVNPVHYFQPTLFDDSDPEPETKPEDVLAELKVSTSDMERWHQNGWIIYRLHELSQFCHRDECEIRFIAPIARSGLSDSQINQLLKELRAPYAYGDDVAYHFKYGWVTPQHAFDFVSSNVDEWLDQLGEEEDFDRLAEIGNKIHGLLYSDVEEAQEEDDDEGDERPDTRSEDTTTH